MLILIASFNLFVSGCQLRTGSSTSPIQETKLPPPIGLRIVYLNAAYTPYDPDPVSFNEKKWADLSKVVRDLLLHLGYHQKPERVVLSGFTLPDEPPWEPRFAKSPIIKWVWLEWATADPTSVTEPYRKFHQYDLRRGPTISIAGKDYTVAEMVIVQDPTSLQTQLLIRENLESDHLLRWDVGKESYGFAEWHIKWAEEMQKQENEWMGE